MGRASLVSLMIFLGTVNSVHPDHTDLQPPAPVFSGALGLRQYGSPIMMNAILSSCSIWGPENSGCIRQVAVQDKLYFYTGEKPCFFYLFLLFFFFTVTFVLSSHPGDQKFVAL
jgi:hypothetical protein